MRVDAHDSWETEGDAAPDLVGLFGEGDGGVPDQLLRTPVAAFRAFCGGIAGPDRAGVYKITFGTTEDFKRALMDVTDYAHEFFEVEVRTVRVKKEEIE